MGANGTKPIQSLARGLSLLEYVGKAGRPVSVPEMTRHLEIDRSSVFRLANTLRLHGFLAHAPGQKSYVLGSAFLRLAGELPWGAVTQMGEGYLAAAVGGTGRHADVEAREASFVDAEAAYQSLDVSADLGR